MSLIAAKEKTILDSSNVFFIRGSFPLVTSKCVSTLYYTNFCTRHQVLLPKARDKFSWALLLLFDKRRSAFCAVKSKSHPRGSLRKGGINFVFIRFSKKPDYLLASSIATATATCHHINCEQLM